MNGNTPAAEKSENNNLTADPNSDAGMLPDWLGGGLQTTNNTENISENPILETPSQNLSTASDSSSSEETNTELPDWLNTPIDTLDSKNSTISENENSDTIDEFEQSVNSMPSYTASKSLPENNTEAEVPSWLQELSEKQDTDEVENNSAISHDETEDNLPDWLVSSAEKIETNTDEEDDFSEINNSLEVSPIVEEKPKKPRTPRKKANSESSEIPKIETPAKKAVKTKKKNEETPTENTEKTARKTKKTNTDPEIPDWLK